jgi:hypothetical protein
MDNYTRLLLSSHGVWQSAAPTAHHSADRLAEEAEERFDGRVTGLYSDAHGCTSNHVVRAWFLRDTSVGSQKPVLNFSYIF